MVIAHISLLLAQVPVLNLIIVSVQYLVVILLAAVMLALFLGKGKRILGNTPADGEMPIIKLSNNPPQSTSDARGQVVSASPANIQPEWAGASFPGPQHWEGWNVQQPVDQQPVASWDDLPLIQSTGVGGSGFSPSWNTPQAPQADSIASGSPGTPPQPSTPQFQVVEEQPNTDITTPLTNNTEPSENRAQGHPLQQEASGEFDGKTLYLRPSPPAKPLDAFGKPE